MTTDDFLSQLPYELQVEISENQFHKVLNPSEMDEARRRIEPFFAAAARLDNAMKVARTAVENFHQLPSARPAI